ncbi:MAG: hypothetical protein WAO21_08755 [Verrucomicrobiia bacterium]
MMLRQVLRLMLRWLLRSMPTSVLREMPTLVPTVVPTVVLPVLRTVLLRQVPTTFANRGAKRMLTTVRTVLLTLLQTVHGQTTTTAKDTTANNPRRAVAIRSGRATNGDEANAVETLFADRHLPRLAPVTKLLATASQGCLEKNERRVEHCRMKRCQSERGQVVRLPVEKPAAATRREHQDNTSPARRKEQTSP